jgi:hypothetical protein
MDKKDNGLEKLCKIYLNLNDEEKEKIIILGEGLLKSQKIITDEISYLSERKENTETNIA